MRSKVGIVVQFRDPNTMETLPTEILEVIFMELSRSSLIDIVNCSRTFMRWKNIIEKMFKKDGR